MPTTRPRTLRSAASNYRLSALIARRAVRQARAVRGNGYAAVTAVVVAHQFANAQTSQVAVGQMLAEQSIDAQPEAALDLASFTIDPATMTRMLEQVERDAQALLAEVNLEFDRLVDSLVQDAARAAESVSVAVRPDVYHVRFVSPPCCSRCAILAGRAYRWSTGFQRHPGCDCTMVPTTVASPLRQDPESLVEQGLVTGLSKADRRALADGADLGRVVNIRQQATSLLDAGHSLRRGGRPTPAAIYRRFPDDREKAIEQLRLFGYLR